MGRGPRTLQLIVLVAVFVCVGAIGYRLSAQSRLTLSATFARQVLATSAEAPFALRFFTTAVKTDSTGRIITGPTSDPTKTLVGAEFAGDRAGVARYTKILFGADYFNGRADPGTRIDPNNPQVSSGKQHWPNVPQPFRSWPNALALTAAGDKLYVTLPGREGYPDWRVAVVDTTGRTVRRWIDLRAVGSTRATRPVAVAVSPLNTTIYPREYAVVLNEYANFASVIDTASDSIVGEFKTGFYAEDLAFNATGTRLYTTDRFNDQVRVFRIDRGPMFTQIAAIPTGRSDLERANPRDLDLSADGRTLYVANTLGHTIAAINVDADANTLLGNLVVGGLATDVKIAGRWGIVSGHETNTVLNGPDTGDGLPKSDFRRNDGSPLGYTPVMTDATRATTFDDLGSELNVFEVSTNRFVQRYVDIERDKSMLAVPGQVVDLGDYRPDQEIIRGSGPEQIVVRGDLLLVTQMHSDKVEVFRVNQTGPATTALAHVTTEFTGGITPQGITVSPDGRTVYVANMQTEDVSVLGLDSTGRLTRQALVTVGVTGKTPDPTKGSNGQNLFATSEEIGLRWFFTQSYSDDGQKSCGHCHWQSRHDGSQWNVGANAVGGVKVCPQNKDISDNWPEWFEGLNNDMTAYASACNGELNVAERRTALFPQTDLVARLQARDAFVLQRTEANSRAIGRPELSGKTFKIGYYDMAFLQILWSQNETRLMPNPLRQFPSASEQTLVSLGRDLFTKEVNAGGVGCASCHHNGNKTSNGVVDDTFQDYNIHEPGVIAETTVDNEGPFTRLQNDYFFQPFGPPQDEGGRQNISSRNTKHLRAFWDSVPNWLHHGDAHTIREILLPPDSPLLRPGERGFNFRTVRTDHTRRVSADCLGRPCPQLPTEVPITFADSGDDGSCTRLGGDGKGPLCVSLDSPHVAVSGPSTAYPDGRLQIDRLGTRNVAPLIVGGQINPALATNQIMVIKDTHGQTSTLSAGQIDALSAYLRSLQK
jgi:DNA-binding beta-propeller fold protein YncE